MADKNKKNFTPDKNSNEHFSGHIEAIRRKSGKNPDFSKAFFFMVWKKNPCFHTMKKNPCFHTMKKNPCFHTMKKNPCFHTMKKNLVFTDWQLKNKTFHHFVTIEQSYMFNTHFQLKVRSLKNLVWNSFFWAPLALECYTSLRRASPYFALLHLAALGFAICFVRLARLRSV